MKENKILISILIPTYNRRKYLEECLNSVVEQEGFKKDEIEILIGDNSEGDETKKFMDNFLKKNHKYHIDYIKNKGNIGGTPNLNNLLGLSKGEYFIFLSDDDKFYDKNSLKLLYDSLLKYKLDVCYGKYRVIDGDGNDKGDFKPHTKIKINQDIYYDTFDEQMVSHSISFGGILYKKFGYKYDGKSRWFGDWLMNLQYLYDGKKVALINVYTFYYRVHSGNDCNTIPKYYDLKFLLYAYNYFNLSFGLRLKLIFYKVISRLKNFFYLSIRHV